MPLNLDQLERGKFYRVVAPPRRVGDIVVGTGQVRGRDGARSYGCLIHVGDQPSWGPPGGLVSNESFRFEPVNFLFDGLEMPTPATPRAVTQHDLAAAHDGGSLVWWRARPGWSGPARWTPVTDPDHGCHAPDEVACEWDDYTRWYEFTFNPETP